MNMTTLTTAMVTSVGSDRQAYYLFKSLHQIAKVMAAIGILIIPAALVFEFAIIMIVYVAVMSSIACIAKKLRNDAACRHNAGLDRLFASFTDKPQAY